MPEIVPSSRRTIESGPTSAPVDTSAVTAHIPFPRGSNHGSATATSTTLYFAVATATPRYRIIPSPASAARLNVTRSPSRAAPFFVLTFPPAAFANCAMVAASMVKSGVAAGGVFGPGSEENGIGTNVSSAGFTEPAPAYTYTPHRSPGVWAGGSTTRRAVNVPSGFMVCVWRAIDRRKADGIDSNVPAGIIHAIPLSWGCFR